MSEIDTRDFLTILKDGVHKGLRIVNIRSKETYGSIKIKNEMRRLRKKRARATLDMGNMIYRTYKYKGNINEDIVLAKCSEIDGIEEEISDWEQKLETVHLDAQKALGSLKALSRPNVIAICECGNEIYEGAELCDKCSKKVEPSIAEDIKK